MNLHNKYCKENIKLNHKDKGSVFGNTLFLITIGGETMAIHVDEAALSDLKNALETAGEDYKRDYARLKSLISEITSGDIQGDPATDLLNKFQAKEDTFNKIAETIDDAEEYMGLQKQSFSQMISDLSSGMR